MIDINCTINSIFNAVDKDIGDNFDFVITVRQSRTLWQYNPTIICRTPERTLEFDFRESEPFDSAFLQQQLNRVPNNLPRPDICTRPIQGPVQLDIDRSELTAVCDLR